MSLKKETKMQFVHTDGRKHLIVFLTYHFLILWLGLNNSGKSSSPNRQLTETCETFKTSNVFLHTYQLKCLSRH